MKLSKQERIGAFIIAIVVILAVGIFVFIKPRFEKIGTTSETLIAKQAEFTAAMEKQATKDDLKQQVLDAYKEGEKQADMFFEELTQYEAEEEFRAFLEQCEANVVVEELTVGVPETASLTPLYFTEPEITYALKSYVTQGLEPTEEELAAAKRLETIQSTLGAGQEVGAIKLSFTVSAIDQDELLKFCDEVNSYYKDEHGVSTRKAIRLSGFAFEYPLIEEEYKKMIEEITVKAEESGTKELYKNYGRTPPAKEQPGNGEENENDDEKELVLSDNLISVSTTLTFYSVERMQDPADQLDQQDGINM